MSSDSLLPIPGDLDTIWAQHKALTSTFQRLQDSSDCVRSVRLERWTGQAADDAAELRFRLVKELLRAADATKDAADATVRYAMTLAEAQQRRKMLVLALAGDPAGTAVANEDISRWLDQVRSESAAASAQINAARSELSAVSTVFRDPPPPLPLHWEPSRTPRPPDRHKGSSPYTATENQAKYTSQMDDLNRSVAEGRDLIVPIRGVTSWDEWRQREGREIGCLS